MWSVRGSRLAAPGAEKANAVSIQEASKVILKKVCGKVSSGFGETTTRPGDEGSAQAIITLWHFAG